MEMQSDSQEIHNVPLHYPAPGEKQRLFVDMDGTLAVFTPVDELETLYQEGYFRNLDPHINVVEAVREIINNYPEIEVHILSAYLTDSQYALREKNAWLDQYLPEIDQSHRIFGPCGSDKKEWIPGGIRTTDHLLDDYTKNLNNWQPPARGIKLLNAINHTRGTWQHDRIRYDRPPADLAAGIVDIMQGRQQVFDDKVSQRTELKIQNQVVSFYSGQMNAVLSALGPNGETIGYIKYAEFQEAPYIQYIEVKEDHRRQGVATALLRELQNLYKSQEIDWGMTTEDGTKLKEAVTYGVEDFEVKSLVERLQAAKAALQINEGKLNELYKVENLTQEQSLEFERLGTDWDTLVEEIRDLERELDGRNIERTFIKMAEENERSGNMAQNDMVKIQSAGRSNYNGYVALMQFDRDKPWGENGAKVFLGKSANYDSRGNYDNSDNSLVLISENHKMLGFLCGEGWVESQQAMINNGAFSAADYAEFAQLKEGVLKQFQDAQIREVRFSIDINQRERDVESGVSFAYPEWAGQTETYNERLETVFWWEDKNDIPGEDRAVAYHRDDSGARAFSTAKNWADVERRYSEILGENDGEIVRLTDQEKDFLRNLAAYDLLYAKAGPVLEAFEKQNYAEYPTARDFFLDERSRQSPAPWGLELAEGSAPARLVIMTTERIGYPDAIHEIAYNQPMDDEDYVDYREDPESFLERTYARLGNAGAQPSNYYGHSPSVGDAIVVMSQNGVTAHYVANFGFDLAPEIDRVMSHEQQRAVRMGMTVREEMALLEKLNDFAYANGGNQFISAVEEQTRGRLNALREEYIPVFNLADIRGVSEREQDKLQVLHGWEEANNVENPIAIYVDGVYYVSNSAVRAALNGSDSNSRVGAGERLQAEINHRFEKAAREISEGYPHFYRLHASPRPLGDQGQYDFFVQRYERSTTEPGVIPGDIVYIGDSKTAIEVTNHLNAGSEYGEYLEENFELRRQLGMGALMGDVSKWMVGGQSEELSELRDWRVDRVTRAMEAAGYSLDPIESSAERGVFNGDYGARMEFETVLEAEEWLEGVVFDDPEMSDAVEKIMHPERFVLEGLSQQDMTNLIFEYENLHNIPATNDFIPEVDRMTTWDAEHSVAVIKPVYGENYVFDAQAVAEARCREILSTESRENIHQAYNAILEAQQERMGLEIGGLAGRLQEQAAGDMNRQDSPWGSWFARISHPDRPQDYIELDITGYSTRNSVVESATLVLNGNVHEQIQMNEMSFDDYGNEEGFDTGFAAAAAELAKRFDPSIAENYVLYAPAGWSEHTLEEHYQMLRDRGFDDMPNYEAYNARTAEAERFREILNSAPEFRYQLLHRMKADCDYYLGYGNRNPRNLWASSMEEQIATMRAIWNSFPENAKPEWLSFEDIQQYEDSMANSQNIEEKSEKVAEENQIRIAIESTDDYYEPGFHSDLIDSGIQNEDGSYGKVKDYYRIVAINESGRVAAFDDRIFESSAEARAAVAELPGLELVTYDDLVHEAEKIISQRAQAQRSGTQLTILFRDEQNDIEAGINADGDLYLSGSGSGYNLADTIENRHAIERDIERYTGQQVDLVGDMQEPEMEEDNGTISFYVAESMEFPTLGEYHEGLTLQEAFTVYDSIPSERLNGGKGIGFNLQDGSIYAGEFALLIGNEIQTDVINEIGHFRNSLLVQKAIEDCAEELNRRNGIGRERPASFIANYYVVEDLNDAPLSIQEFKDLDIAMSAYAALPSNRMKALGIRNTNELPGSLDFIQCRNGVDTLIFDNLQVPGWNNPEVQDAAMKIMDAVEQMMKNAHREELNENATIASIINRCEAMGYSEEQMKDVQGWVTRGVPDFILEILANQDFDYYQFLEIRYGLYDELSPEQFALFAKEEFWHLQMLEIREGFAKGLTVEQVAAYARPELDPDQMFRIRNMLQDSFSIEEVSILSDPNLTIDQADQIERDLRNGLSLEEAMKNAASVLAESYEPIPNHYYYPDLDLNGTAEELFIQARNGYIEDPAALAQLQEILSNPVEQKADQAFYVGILKEIAEDKGEQPYVFAQIKKDILDGVHPGEVSLRDGLTLVVLRDGNDSVVIDLRDYSAEDDASFVGGHSMSQDEFLKMTAQEFTETVNSIYAYNMAIEQRGQEEERSVEPLVDISNISYDDEGYLHFTVEADGYQLEGLYRVLDPANGEDMELVSIDFGDRHPIIERQWDRIADALYDEAYDRYNEMIDQRFEHKDRLVQAMAMAGYIYNEQASTPGHHVFDAGQGGITFVNLDAAYRWFDGYMMLADHPLEAQMERILNPEQYASPIPEGDEWFYNDPDRGDVIAVHYNPDSNAGGQFVLQYLSYDLIGEALKTANNNEERFFEVLNDQATVELVDIDTLSFKELAAHYRNTAPDFTHGFVYGDGSAMAKLVQIAKDGLENQNIRVGDSIRIGENECSVVDEWRDAADSYVLGNSVEDSDFYYAIVNGNNANVIEYDERPTREKVEGDFADLEAARAIDRYEAEFGADGSRVFPNLNADEAVYRLDDKQYLYIQQYDEGYDYTLYDADMKELDGGQLDNMTLNMEQARNEILSLHDMRPERIEAISIEEYERIGYEAERRNRPLTYSENEALVKLAERIDNFMYDYDYYTYADDVGIDLEARSEHRAHLANALENIEYSPMIDTFRNIIAEEEAGDNLNSEQVEQAKAILYDLTHLEEYQKNYAAEQQNTGEVRDPMVALAARLDSFAFDANREEWSASWSQEVDELAEDLRNGNVEAPAQWLASAERYLVATNDEERNAALIREARDLSYTLEHLDLYQQFYGRNVEPNAAIPIEEFKREGRTLEGSQIPGRYIPANSIGYADRSEIFNAVRAFEEANNLPPAERVIHNGTYDDKDYLYQGYNHHIGRSHRNDLSIQPYMERLTAMAEDKSKHISLLSLVSEVYYAQQNGLTHEQIDMILTDAESRSAPLDAIQNLRHACESGLTQEQIAVLIGEDSFAQESLMGYMAEGGSIENAKALKGCDVAQYYILSGHLSKGDFGPDMVQAIIQAGKGIKDWTMADFDRQKAELGTNGPEYPRYRFSSIDFEFFTEYLAEAAAVDKTITPDMISTIGKEFVEQNEVNSMKRFVENHGGFRSFDAHREETVSERSVDMEKEDPMQEGVSLPDGKKDPKEQLAQQLEQGIRNVLSSENFKNWLDTSRKMFLNNYSFNNAILVWLQRPDASYTMGYEQWKDYGRTVAKGADGIKIFVPVIAYEKKEGALWTMIKGNLDKQLRDDPSLPQAVYRIGMSKLEVTKANGLYGLRVNGKEMGLKSEKDMQKFIKHNVLGKVAMYFTVGTVFDVKDTVVPEYLWVKKGFTKAEMVKDENGKPVKNRRGEYKIINTPERQAKFQADLDMSVPEIDPAKAAILYESLKAVSERNGIHVVEKDRQDDNTLSNGADGYYSREFTKENPKGFIVMPTDLEPTKAVSVMLHEMSHSELHGNLTKLAQQMGEDKIPSKMREIQAESVAYLVGKNFGIESDLSSFQYLAAYTQGFELQALSKSIEVIYNECKQLTNELKTELEIRGLNMDLSEREPSLMDKEAVQTLSKAYVSYALEQSNRIADIEKELPDLVEQNRGKDSALAVLVAQASNVQRQKEDVALVQEKVAALEKADSYAGQKECIEQIEAVKNRVENYKKGFADLTVQFQDLSRSEQSLKDRFVADPVATLKDMGANMDYVELGALNDAQIGYLAKSEYVSRELAPMLRSDPAQFAEKACERASQIENIASKNGMFVEVSFCEQWTDKPIVESGALMHPKVADTIIKQAEIQVRGLKAEAEKMGDYFPYNKCDLMVYQAANGEISKAFKTRVDIGDGSQGSLIDHLKQIPSAKTLAEDFEKATRERGSKEKILFNEASRGASRNEPEKEPIRTARAKTAKEWAQEVSAQRDAEKVKAKDDDKDHRRAAKSDRATNKDDGHER